MTIQTPRCLVPPALLAIIVLTTSCGSSDGTTPGFSPNAYASASPDTGPDTADDGSPTLDASPEGDSGLADANDDVPGDTSAADALPTVCPPPPDCNVPTPPLGAARGWNNVLSQVTALSGPRRHRGRDLFVLEGQEAWVLGKFAYGALDGDIQDEDVDVYLLRDCGSHEEVSAATTLAHRGSRSTPSRHSSRSDTSGPGTSASRWGSSEG